LDDPLLLGQLEAQVRYESLEGETAFRSGGLCRIRKKPIIIINARVTVREKIKTLVEALRRFDLSNIYLKPALRDLLEKAPEEKEALPRSRGN
jgi:hypothetical protein